MWTGHAFARAPSLFWRYGAGAWGDLLGPHPLCCGSVGVEVITAHGEVPPRGLS